MNTPGVSLPDGGSFPAIVLSLILFTTGALPAAAQTLDDGLMMSSRALCTGFLYTHDSWSEYWEGDLKRDNENIGTLTTQSVAWVGVYGVAEGLNAVAMLPYVWTNASDGFFHGMQGLQDLTIGAKYRLLRTPLTSRGTLRVFVAASVGVPVDDYTPDFLPFSIGLGSRRATGRFILNFTSPAGWFVNGSTAYTVRTNVKLDRPAYYTNGRLYLTDEVGMPDIFDYAVTAGYRKGRVYVPITLSQQRTLGGGDIRRNDMPFVSNRMNFVRLEAVVMYTLPTPADLAVRVGASNVVAGRNVGQSTGLTGGLLYTINL